MELIVASRERRFSCQIGFRTSEKAKHINLFIFKKIEKEKIREGNGLMKKEVKSE